MIASAHAVFDARLLTRARTTSCIALMVLLPILLVACTSNVRGYPGARRPASDLAMLWLPELRLDAIDGVPLNADAPARVDILPGFHRIAVTATFGRMRGHTLGQPFEAELAAQAQHVYYLFPRSHGLRSRLAVRDLGVGFVPPRRPLLGGEEYRQALEVAKKEGVEP